MEWKVKSSGRYEIVLLSYAAVFACYCLLVARMTFGMKGEGSFLFNFFITGIFFFLIIIALVTLPISWMRKKKIPSSILVKGNDNNLQATFFNDPTPIEYPIDEIAFKKIETSFFTVLVFYRKVISERGHTLYFETFNLCAPFLTASWDIKKIQEIQSFLKSLEVEEYTLGKKKHIIEYIFG